METVSASDIVRQFGHWQDKALSSPVYIRHHGRPKLVLTSIDFVEQLVAEHARLGPDRRSIEALLELIDSIVIVTDRNQCVIGMSPPARHHFARSDWHGKTLDDLLPDQMRPIVVRAATDVCETKLSDSFQLRIGPHADRRLDVTVQPFGDGVCIVAHDRTASDERRDRDALDCAVRQTLDILGSVAVLRINLRGFIVRASESFETLSGLSCDAYRSVRLPTLFDIGSRMAVSDAFERAIDEVQPQLVTARLVVNTAAPRTVQIAFSAEMLRSSIDAIIATIETVA